MSRSLKRFALAFLIVACIPLAIRADDTAAVAAPAEDATAKTLRKISEDLETLLLESRRHETEMKNTLRDMDRRLSEIEREIEDINRTIERMGR